MSMSSWISIDTLLFISEQGFSEWLTTITRVISISSINRGDISSRITVNINRDSSFFTQKVDYVRSDGRHVRVGENIVTRCTFTPSLSDSNFIPNFTSATAKKNIYTLKAHI